ncbi:MAG TPA: PfkB family carbohydrate kinase [Thermoanaerobaculia bacterium]|nr:PfkB family carbohydrate kinase [Thermoanaerobaculia bacterium]
MERIVPVRSSHAQPPTRARLLELVDDFADRRVLLLVDLVADRFVVGSPKRISREAPVLILRWSGETLAPGGGANAAANVRALGGRPLPVGWVGDDDSGRALVEALAGAGIETGGILVRSGWTTPTKTRLLAGFPTGIKQQVVRIDREEAAIVGAGERAELASAIRRLGAEARVAILSDYGYGSVPPELLPEVRAALGAGSTVLVDSRYRLGDFHGADGATPNEEEAEALHGGPLDLGGGIDRAGAALRDRLGAAFLLITRGNLGMALFEPDGAVHVPVHGSDQVADVTGAGDTVIGTFALALAAGGTPLEAALLANYAGGVVVQKLGTATLDRDELRAAIASDERPLEELRWARS